MGAIILGDRMTSRAIFLGFGILLSAPSLFTQQTGASATHTLKPTPKTVAWGYYDAKAAPVLRVKSGNRCATLPIRSRTKGPAGTFLRGRFTLKARKLATCWK